MLVFEVRARCGDAQHAPAGGDEIFALPFGARLEHHGAVYTISIPVIFSPVWNVPGYPPDAITTQVAGSGDQSRRSHPSEPRAAAISTSPQSLSRRIISGCVSGSPRRTLNSSTLGPSARHHQAGVEETSIIRSLGPPAR